MTIHEMRESFKILLRRNDVPQIALRAGLSRSSVRNFYAGRNVLSRDSCLKILAATSDLYEDRESISARLSEKCEKIIKG